MQIVCIVGQLLHCRLCVYGRLNRQTKLSRFGLNLSANNAEFVNFYEKNPALWSDGERTMARMFPSAWPAFKYLQLQNRYGMQPSRTNWNGTCWWHMTDSCAQQLPATQQKLNYRCIFITSSWMRSNRLSKPTPGCEWLVDWRHLTRRLILIQHSISSKPRNGRTTNYNGTHQTTEICHLSIWRITKSGNRTSYSSTPPLETTSTTLAAQML